MERLIAGGLMRCRSVGAWEGVQCSGKGSGATALFFRKEWREEVCWVELL